MRLVALLLLVFPGLVYNFNILMGKLLGYEI